MKTLQDYIDKLNALNFKDMYNSDFFLTWEKTDDELEAVFTLADALRFMRENNISTKVFESGLGISLFRDNSTRTRFSFASACNLLGLEVQDLDEGKSQIAHGETVRETANMIIPQIAENLTRSGVKDIPQVCPVCGGATKIKMENETKTLYCTNPECQAKHLKSFALFVSRDAMNIEGLSEATLEKFIGEGFIRDFTDIYHLDRYEETIKTLEGFGEKSYAKLITSVENSRSTTMPKVIYSLGIANIGLSNAKMICRAFDNDPQRMMQATVEELVDIQGVGEVIARTFVDYFSDETHRDLFKRLLQEVKLQKEEGEESAQIFENMNFVITGSVEHFANRREVKEIIESRGGKVTGSVTGKTNYLINNDVQSASSKNKKAKELNVPIISESQFLEMLETGTV